MYCFRLRNPLVPHHGGIAILLAIASVLAGCQTAVDDRVPDAPDETWFSLVEAPTAAVPDTPWFWTPVTIGEQPLVGDAPTVSDDGQRVLFGDHESRDGGETWASWTPRAWAAWSPQMTHGFDARTGEVSHDGGATWSTVALPASFDRQNPTVTDGGVVFAWTSDGSGLSRLRPGAAEWQPLSLKGPCTLSASSDGRVLVAANRWLSTDHGLTWAALSLSLREPRVKVSPDGVLRVLGFRADSTLVIQSSGDGVAWNSGPTLLVPEGTRDFVGSGFLSQDGLRAVAYWQGQAVLTSDGGQTWTSYFRESWNSYLYPLAGGAVLANAPYATTGSLSRSPGPGEPFAVLTAPGSKLERLSVSADGLTLTGVLGDRAWSSTDAKTWVPVTPPSPPTPFDILFQRRVTTPDGVHGVEIRYSSGEYNDTTEMGWSRERIQVFHAGTRRTVATLIRGEGMDQQLLEVFVALSARGTTISATVDLQGRGTRSVISSDGGIHWWTAPPITVLAWDEDGTRGAGVNSEMRLCTSANGGLSWYPATSSPAYGTRAVFFAGGLFVASPSKPAVFGTKTSGD